MKYFTQSQGRKTDLLEAYNQWIPGSCTQEPGFHYTCSFSAPEGLPGISVFVCLFVFFLAQLWTVLFPWQYLNIGRVDATSKGGTERAAESVCSSLPVSNSHFKVQVSTLLSFEGAVISNFIASPFLGFCSSKVCQPSKVQFAVSLSPGALLHFCAELTYCSLKQHLQGGHLMDFTH